MINDTYILLKENITEIKKQIINVEFKMVLRK